MATNERKIYRSPKVVKDLRFISSSQSQAFNCSESYNSETKVGGNGQVRRIVFPGDWNVSDVIFYVYEDESFTNPMTLYTTDCSSPVGVITLTSARPFSTIALPAPCFDSVVYFRMISTLVQNCTVGIVLESLYQVEQ